jgi:hypothetical protein
LIRSFLLGSRSWEQFSILLARLSLRVEENAMSCRLSLALSAVSSFVRV